ncbi:unnamed protein product [Phytophthora lilii]|uniref:Unnamed protein product n=1 Tax=Phytophthora lilii TaxID=2077276 RepID=A0A9W6THH8_9STRA|nr:unnamed protein product [Phytophthora lilii]
MKDVDELLVEGVETLEDYLSEQEVASSKIKQVCGAAANAQAESDVNATSCGCTGVSEADEGQASATGARAERGKTNAVDEKDGDSSLHHRRGGKANQEKDLIRPEASDASANLKSDTLLWFSSLPPSDLRQAQKQFANGGLACSRFLSRKLI